MAMPAPIRRRLEVVCPCSGVATGLLLSDCWEAWMRGMRWQRAGRMDGLEQARGILAPQPRTEVDICISSAGRVEVSFAGARESAILLYHDVIDGV